MSKIIKTAKVLRRNWKKSTFFFGILAYGTSYGIEKYQTFQMMRTYCEEAKAFGEKTLPNLTKPKHVTVILNPEANNKKSNIQFEKFAAPLLHLAGYKVSVFQTEKSKQAQELMEVMSNTDVVLVAGGNGTVHEVVTGLLRRPDETEQLPLGIIPLGKTNTVAKHLFGSRSASHAQLMAEAAMAVIRETTILLDVMKIQCEGLEQEKPVYAVCCFEQGTFADLEQIVPKYWYLGPLKAKYTYFKSCFKEQQTINDAKLQYVAPCNGCSRCYVPPGSKVKSNQNGRWWSAFIPRKPDTKISAVSQDYSSVINEECGKHFILHPSYSNVSVSTLAVDNKRLDFPSSLWVKIYPENLSAKQFYSSGLQYQNSKVQDSSAIANIVEARGLIIDKNDSASSETEEYCYIDNEKYPRKSCNISLLPKQVLIYG